MPDHSILTMRSLPITGPGIYRMSAEEYHRDPVSGPSLSASIAKVLISATPRHAFIAHPRLNPEFEEKDNKKFDIGEATHSVVLGHGRQVHEIDADDYKGGKAKAEREEAKKAGRIPLLKEQHDRVKVMRRAIREQLDASGLADVFSPAHGVGESVIVWDDPYAGWCRSQIDWLSDDMLVIDDLKITGTAISSNERLAYHVADMGYEVQAAFYDRGLRVLRPDLAGRIKFRFHFVEDSPPHAMRSIELDAAAITIGRKKVSVAMGLWQRCLSTGQWPMHAPEVSRIEYPARAESIWTTRELEDDTIADFISADPFLMPLVENPAPSTPKDFIMAG